MADAEFGLKLLASVCRVCKKIICCKQLGPNLRNHGIDSAASEGFDVEECLWGPHVVDPTRTRDVDIKKTEKRIVEDCDDISLCR